jgi:hypothetical protein
MSKKKEGYENPLFQIAGNQVQSERPSFISQPPQEEPEVESAVAAQTRTPRKKSGNKGERITEQLTIYLTRSQLEKLYDLQNAFRRKHKANITPIEIVRQAIERLTLEELVLPKHQRKTQGQTGTPER